MKENILPLAIDFAKGAHYSTGHFYDKIHPYSYHLKMVYDFGVKYQHLLLDDYERNIALSTCWTHDVIEDCRMTYNDVKEVLGVEIAEVTYALTNEKGKSRKQRANDKYYEGIRNTPLATFVKLCDRLANVSYSKQQGSSMLDAYRKDQEYFTAQLYDAEFDVMFSELNDLLK